MLDLAVATQAETYERMREPLAERGIRTRHLQTESRTLPLTQPRAEFDEFDVGFVYPSRLMEGGAVSALLGIPWVNGPKAILTSRNKGGVLARLDQEAVSVPDTVMVSDPIDEQELRTAFADFDPPVVVKPNSATRGVGVTKVSDSDSLLGIADYFELIHDFRATGDKSFLLQEFVPDARDYRVMVIDGEYVGAVERKLPDAAQAAGQWKQNVHRNATADRVDLPAELQTLAERVAAILEIQYLGVDLLVTENRTLVAETNARPTIDTADKYEPDFYDRLAALIRTQSNRVD